MAGELYATLEDINTHLPGDKCQITDSDDDDLQIDTYRFIKSLLTGTFSATVIATWVSPATTPELIRAVAGRLIAANWYAKCYYEDIPGYEDNSYGQMRYNEAIGMLNDIRSGTLTVLDPSGEAIDNSYAMTADDFWPNNTTDAPKFTMDRVIG